MLHHTSSSSKLGIKDSGIVIPSRDGLGGSTNSLYISGEASELDVEVCEPVSCELEAHLSELVRSMGGSLIWGNESNGVVTYMYSYKYPLDTCNIRCPFLKGSFITGTTCILCIKSPTYNYIVLSHTSV